MTDPEGTWYGEEPTQWLTLSVVTIGVLISLHDPAPVFRVALFVLFTVLATLALYGTHKSMTHTND